jgi:hypothetical protein
MKRVAYSLAIAATVGMVSSAGFAADMAVKAPPAAAAPPSPWDIVVTAAMMNDYNFRGVTQSNHKPSAQAGFELRYNATSTFQLYAGVSGESISFPNDAAAEVDFYGGFRPTFDKLALDFGVWEYYYPGGECYGAAAPNPPFNAGVCSTPIFGAAVPNPNNAFSPTGGVTVKSNESFTEIYGKATYTFNDNWSAGIQEWYSPSVLNTGAYGWYTTGNLTYTAPSNTLPNGVGLYVSGDAGYWDLGTSDLFYGTNIAGPYATGVKYTSYWNWDAGVGFTWKVLTLDLRYYDTNLNKSQCEVFTSAQNGSFSPGNVTTQNPSGLGTNWCSAAFVAKLSASVDFASNLK